MKPHSDDMFFALPPPVKLRRPLRVLTGILVCLANTSGYTQAPDWNWVRPMDAGGEENVRDVAVEPITGNLYVVGAYQSNTALAAPYGLSASSGGSVDAFIAKLDPNGNLIWSRSIGSNQEDAALGVSVASTGLVVVTGYSNGSIAGIGLNNAGSSDAFIVAYNATGAFQWSKIISGPQWEEGTAVVCTGNQVVAYGTFTYDTLLGGLPTAVGLSTGQSYAYINSYDLSGALQWSLTGTSNDHVYTERIAADATNVYVVGSTGGNSMGWRNSAGVTSANVSTTNDDALFCSSISLNGTPAWTRLIDNPGDSDAQCNGVAVDCGAVYITGMSYNASVFPGGITRNMGSVTDYWFLAALSRTTGTTNWLRTAASSTGNGADGYDVSVGRGGQIHVAGMLAGTVTTDGGTVITGGSDQDLCISRFNSDGTAVWYERELSPGNERALAIASVGSGKLVVGGWYEDGLTLGAVNYAGSDNSNLFTSSFTDPAWSSVSNNPARFAQPGPFCGPTGAVNLNSYLVNYADSLRAYFNVSSPQQATGAPNSVGAHFNTAGGWLVLDLIDTVPVGEAINLTWRSQTDMVQARMLVSTSLDGVNWSSVSNYSTSSGTYSVLNHPLASDARYVKVGRHATLGNDFQLDAVRYFGSSATGGTWGGGTHVTATGIFDVSAAGSYPVTYTLVLGQCTYTYMRTIVVHPTAMGGTLVGGGTFCPGSSGTVSLSGHTGSIVRWERSGDGANWSPISNTTPNQTWSGFTGTMHLRAVVGSACGTTVSSTAVLLVQDNTPPVVTCPVDETHYVTDASCTVTYTVPFIPSTDNCGGAINAGTIQLSVSGGGTVVVNNVPVATDAVLNLSAGSIIDLPLGAHLFNQTIFDANGNYSVCAWTISVRDSIAPVVLCPPSQTLYTSTTACSAVATWLTPSFSDNCTSCPSPSQYAAFTLVGDHDGKRYFLSNSIATYHSAVAVAQSMGHHLLSIGTAAESAFIEAYLSSIGSDPVWIGLSDEVVEGTFLWHSGEPLAYQNWMGGEPNNIGNEDYVFMIGSGANSGTWNDVPGTVEVRYIIEAPCPALAAMQVGGPTNGSMFPLGTTDILYTALDAAGNSSSCEFSITVLDSIPPVFDNCPGTLTVNTDPNSCEHLYTFPTLESSDNCDADTESEYRAFILEAGNTLWQDVTGQVDHAFAPGLHQLMEIHRDDAGNVDTCSWSLNVIDANAPTITCPTIIPQLSVGAGCTVAIPDYTTSATATGNCSGNGGLVITQSPAPNTLLGKGTHTITLTATQAGLSASCTFVVPIVDNSAPTFVGCPTDMTVDAPSNACSATVSWTPPTVSDNCTGASITQTAGPAPGSSFPIGTHIITYTALDAANNPATCSFLITVGDRGEPIFTCTADIAVNATPGLCGAVVNYTIPTATDLCGTITLTRLNGPASGSLFPLGTTLVRYRAVDNATPANSSECSFWVTVFDATPPQLTACTNITANNTAGACSAVVNYTAPSASEPCSTCPTGAVPTNYVLLGTYQGRTYYFRNSTMSWLSANNAAIAAGGHLAIIRDAAQNAWLRSAVDAAGGTNQSFWIGLNDVSTEGNWRWMNSTPAVFLNWDTNEPNSNGGNEDYALMKANGKWNDEKTTSSFRSVIEVESSCITPVLVSGTGTASGSSFHVGTTTVSYQSTDPAGNTSTCSFNVVVTDATAPTFGPTPNVLAFVPANACSIAAPNYPTPTDNCPGVTIQYLGGPVPGDPLAPGAHQMRYRAVDAAGLPSAIQIMNVTVQDTIRPTITSCPTNMSVPTTIGSCTGLVSWTPPAVTDNCVGATIMQTTGPVNGTALTPGSYSVTYTATDASGNQGVCAFSINVFDLEPTTITCPNDTTLEATPGSCSASFLYDVPIVQDNCGGPWSALFVSGLPPGDFPIGLTTTEYNGSFGGTTVTCTFNVNVIDIEAPSVYCPLYDSLQYFLNADCELAWPNLLDSITVYDCSAVNGVMWPPADTIITQPGVYAMTMDYTDAFGNHTDNDHLIWVRDTIRPTITCPGDLSITAPPGSCFGTVNLPGPLVATDNCGTQPWTTNANDGQWPIGDSTVTYTVSDASGNSSSCTFDVAIVPTVVDIAYSASTVCQGSSVIMPSTALPAGGVFSDANQAGTIDPITGAFDPSVATPGLHTLGYVIAGACTSHDWFTVNVIAAPTATITYADSPFCSSETVATMMRTGTAGGTFTATPSLGGLSTTTGHVDLTVASPGTYTVTYSVPPSAVCPAFSTSTTLTIEQAPAANISYAGPYCNNTGQQAVSFSGTAGGSFSATPAGLTLNNANGQITPGSSASTATGSAYTVTYTIPATAACPAFSTTANVTITQAPWAGTGGSLTICSNAAPVALFGSVNGNPAANGSWTNPSNAAHSGTYNPINDGPGNYTYLVAGGPGCTAHHSVVAVTETSAPSAAISYQGSPYCSTTSIASVTRTGSTGGTYSAPAGLSISATSGEVNINSSTPGTYTVTYTIAAAGGCPQFQTTTSIIITPNTTNTTVASACGTYTWSVNGQIYNASGSYVHVDGCNTEVLDLTITTVTGSAEMASACGSYDWFGTTYTTSGTYIHTAGCNSDTLNLTITPNTTNTTVASACGTYTWSVNGQTYNASGSYVHVDGCNTEVLDLTITPVTGSSEMASACGSYDWFGTTYTTSGTYIHTVGCNSDTLNLTITPNTTNTTVASACGTYTWSVNGQTYNASGSYVHVDGCNSDTLNLTITLEATLDASWTPPSTVCSSNSLLDLTTLITGDTGGAWNGPFVVNGILDLSNSGDHLITYVVGSGVCSVSESHVVTVTETPIANAGPDITICGANGQLDAEPYAGGVWSLPNGVTPYGFLTEPELEVHGDFGTYQLFWTVNNGGCTSTDTMTLMLIDNGQALIVDAGPDRSLDVVSSIQLQGSVSPGSTAVWTVAGGSGAFANAFDTTTWVTSLASGYNTLVLTASLGQCVSASDTVIIHVSDLFIPEGFSPNGDGVNDTWEITGIAAFPGSTLQVFNRWGQLVYDSPDYTNQWDGRSNNGRPLPDDTYFHVLNLGGDRTYNGHVILKR